MVDSSAASTGGRNKDRTGPWTNSGPGSFYLGLPEYVARQPAGDTATPDGLLRLGQRNVLNKRKY